MLIIEAIKRLFGRKRLEQLLQEATAMGLSYKLGVMSTRVEGTDAVYSCPVEVVDDVGATVRTGTASARVNAGQDGKRDIARSQLRADAERIMAQSVLDAELAADSAGLRDELNADLAAGLEG